MRDSDRRELAFTILRRVYTTSSFSNLELKGADDFVTASVYGTITYSYSSDFLVKHITGQDTAKMDDDTAVIIRYGVWQIVFSDKVPSYAAVSTSVDLASKFIPRSKGFVNAVLRKIADADEETLDIGRYRPEVMISLKSELYGVLKKSYGRDRAVSVGRAMLGSPDLTVRFDPNRCSREELVTSLNRDGFTVHEGRFMDEALILTKEREARLTKSEAFTEGRIFVQSESAMLVSHVADPKKGDRILECCSAPGGKSTHMAELSGDEADITSTDINSSRLLLIDDNCRRLHIKSVTTLRCDASVELPEGLFDTVTCDVPCSGLGLLGKKPDIRLTLDYERITEIQQIQRKILDNAASRVSPGGRLVYSTCTLNEEENSKQIDRFLQEHDDFYPEDITQKMPSKLIIDNEREEGLRRGRITLFPDTDGSDGFFIGSLRRRD